MVRNHDLQTLPLPVTRAEVIEAQTTDDFCQTVLARQSETKDSKFFEDEGGILRRKNPHHPEYPQIVVPASLKPRILSLAHYHKLAGHPGQSRMLLHNATKVLLASHGCGYPIYS